MLMPEARSMHSSHSLQSSEFEFEQEQDCHRLLSTEIRGREGRMFRSVGDSGITELGPSISRSVPSITLISGPTLMNVKKDAARFNHYGLHVGQSDSKSCHGTHRG